MNGKNIIITGASSGLGKATALKLADSGATLLLIDIDSHGLNEVAASIKSSVRTYTCDISSADQIRQTASKILNDMERVDILINNAGLWSDEELEKDNPERRRKMFEVNTLGTIESTKALEPTFRRQNSGHILNVISASGLDDTSAGDNTLWQSYGASKWALTGFTRALKDTFAADEVRVKVTGYIRVDLIVTYMQMPIDQIRTTNRG